MHHHRVAHLATIGDVCGRIAAAFQIGNRSRWRNGPGRASLIRKHAGIHRDSLHVLNERFGNRAIAVAQLLENTVEHFAANVLGEQFTSQTFISLDHRDPLRKVFGVDVFTIKQCIQPIRKLNLCRLGFFTCDVSTKLSEGRRQSTGLNRKRLRVLFGHCRDGLRNGTRKRLGKQFGIIRPGNRSGAQQQR